MAVAYSKDPPSAREGGLLSHARLVFPPWRKIGESPEDTLRTFLCAQNLSAPVGAEAGRLIRDLDCALQGWEQSGQPWLRGTTLAPPAPPTPRSLSHKHGPNFFISGLCDSQCLRL